MLAAEYSGGGAFLASASSTAITVLDAVGLRAICVLNGHGGVLRSLTWAGPQDLFLVSTCHQGSLLLWPARFRMADEADELAPLSRFYLAQFQQLKGDPPGGHFEKAAYCPEMRRVAAITSTGALIVFEATDDAPVLQVLRVGPGLPVSLLALDSAWLAVGTSEGRLLLVGEAGLQSEVSLERAAINELRLSPCGKYLTAGSDSGALYFLELGWRAKGLLRGWHMGRTGESL